MPHDEALSLNSGRCLWGRACGRADGLGDSEAEGDEEGGTRTAVLSLDSEYITARQRCNIQKEASRVPKVAKKPSEKKAEDQFTKFEVAGSDVAQTLGL